MMIVCATLSIPDCCDLLFRERTWSGGAYDRDRTTHATGAVDIRQLALLLHYALSRA